MYRHQPYGRPVDVYSFAMIFYNMLVGEPPWPELDGMEAVRLAAMERDRPQVPRHIANELANLCRAAWADDPRSRPSFTAVLEILNQFHVKEFKVSFEDARSSGSTGVSLGGGGDSGGCCSLM